MKPGVKDWRLTWVRELVAYSREAVLEIFGLTDATPEVASVLLATLMEKRILKKVTATGDAEEEDPLERLTGSGDYAFCYVGMYCYKGCLVYSLPKYERRYNLREPELQTVDTQPDAGRMEAFAQLMRVIRRYETRIREGLANEQLEQSSDCYLAQLVSLVTDYAEHGEYRDDEQRIALNEQGRILWHRTINRTTPFMQVDEPVYLDTYTSRLVDAEDHFITRLHRVVVKECCRKLQVFGLMELLVLPMIEAIEEDVEELGEYEYLLHCVENELGCQFDSRRRHILHRLKAYLEGQMHRDNDAPEDYFFGCTSFHCVWEDVCRCTLGRDEKDKFSIAPPVWSLDEKAPTNPQPLKLDMLFIDEGKAYVLDAKYYLPENTANGVVVGLPGVGDVTKQFLYRQAIMNSAALDVADNRSIPTKAYNAFVMPLPTEKRDVEPVQHYASVTMPLFTKRIDAEKNKAERIDTYRIAPAVLYEAYINGNECGEVRDALRASLEQYQKRENE